MNRVTVHRALATVSILVMLGIAGRMDTTCEPMTLGIALVEFAAALSFGVNAWLGELMDCRPKRQRGRR